MIRDIVLPLIQPRRQFEDKPDLVDVVPCTFQMFEWPGCNDGALDVSLLDAKQMRRSDLQTLLGQSTTNVSFIGLHGCALLLL